MGADKMGLSNADMEGIIKKWRKANPKINNLWYAVENCATYAVRNKTFKTCRKGVTFHCVDDYLFVYLPSGRKISYFKPKLVKDSNGKETLTYEGTTQSNNGWGVQRTWGGKIVENIVQAIARDCLATAMLNLNYFGYKIVMHVHDEVILEVPKARADEIKLWLDKFTYTLREIFDNSDLNVVFDIEKMTFYIDEPGKKPFAFDELASGYATILDIITDLMMRMEKKVGTKYDMPGFVLIDEVDAHLHLSLQKNILPTLTTLFPNTQFIVTTHSPFVLNSIANAVVYNIETNTLVNTPEGLSKLPYSGIVEGYFGVSELSFKLKKKFCVKNMK